MNSVKDRMVGARAVPGMDAGVSGMKFVFTGTRRYRGVSGYIQNTGCHDVESEDIGGC